jgi:hypothetical protein
VGVASYLSSRAFLLGLLAGYCAMFLFSAGTGPLLRDVRILRYVGALILIIVPASFIAYGLIEGALIKVSFGVFGMVLGLVLYSVSSRTAHEQGKICIALITLLFAWSASLSIGFNTPLLVLGPLFTILIAFVYSGNGVLDLKFTQPILIVAAIAILLSFGVTRTNHIYRETPSSEITESLFRVLPGGKLIYTNPNTYDFLVDLNNAIDAVAARNKKYAIMPDIPGHWAQSRQPNPLPIDWHQGIELSNRDLIDRVIRDLEAERGRTVMIVQKVEANQLADGFVSLDEEHSFWETYPTVTYVRTHFEKTYETKFFELYE